MTNRTRTISVAVGLAVLLSACDSGSRSPSPTSPSRPPGPVAPTTPAPPPATFTLSGVVFELTPTGRAPIEGVQVYCDSCGSPDGHTFAYTDTNGFYSFSWAQDGITPLLVRKAGYDVLNQIRTFPDGTGERDAAVKGDTRFDIQLVRR